jgi:hypothetical protein
MDIENIEKLQDTWNEDMTDREKDIYFTKMTILNARKYQEDSRILVCHFGLRDSIITMNKFHVAEEKSSMERLEKLMSNRGMS